MALKLDAETAVFAALIALSILAWGFALQASGLSLVDAAMIGKVNETLAKMLTPPFYAFLLLFPLSFSLVGAFTEVAEKENVYVASGIGVVGGGLASVLLFKGLLEYAWPLTFFALSVFLFIEIVFWNEEQRRGRALVKAINSGYSYVALMMALGFFIAVAVNVSANPAPYLDDFENTVSGNAVAGMGVKALAQQNANLIIANQRNLLDGLEASDEFQKLQESTDPRAQAFIKKFGRSQQEIGSTDYKERVLQRLLARDPTNLRQVQSPFEMAKTQMPLFEVVEKNFWLFIAFLFTSAFYLIARVVFRPLIVLYSILLDRAMQFVYTQLLLGSGEENAAAQTTPSTSQAPDDPDSQWRWF